jgi:solute carrier family 35
MFTVLRRFSVLITMYGELLILKNKKPLSIQISIYFMVAGAIIAALNDLTFDFYGYIYITLNNIFTAANGIILKQKLDAKTIGEYGLLYYNAIFTLIPMLLLIFQTGEIKKLDSFENTTTFGFWLFFVISSLMGFLLNYSCLLCTKFNSPLTTTVIGCLKNIFVTYLGMFLINDYVYSNFNFIGLTISALASIFYSYLTFKKNSTNTSSSSSSYSSSSVSIATNTTSETTNNNENYFKALTRIVFSRLSLNNSHSNNTNNIHNV